MKQAMADTAAALEKHVNVTGIQLQSNHTSQMSEIKLRLSTIPKKLMRDYVSPWNGVDEQLPSREGKTQNKFNANKQDVRDAISV